jgi:hypothetical protein
MKVKSFSEKDKLICFLNDANEFGNGMYLASACQNFISWQNTFLEHIINNSTHNSELYCYIENMKNKIPVQDANINQILAIDNCFKNSNYDNFEDLVYSFSRRNIFNEDGKIDYLKYNLFKYDFSLLEEELAKLILPGKCLFDNEDQLNFVTYWGEGFRGKKSDSLNKFYEKYPQKDLGDSDQTKIFIYLQQLKKKNNNNLDKFFGSIQLIIFYLVNNNYKQDEYISNIISKAPEYLELDEDCSKFFKEEDGKDFKANQIMNIFFFIEHLCFDNLIATIREEYKSPIDEETQKSIKEKLLKKSNENDLIKTKDLAAALRRFISRYLVGNREVFDIKESLDLYFQLGRNDLWGENIRNLDNLIELVTDKIKEFGLQVGQGLELYKLIGDEDKKILEDRLMKATSELTKGKNNIVEDAFKSDDEEE